jgi:hypothetical protein
VKSSDQRGESPKHDIVVVADGSSGIKDPDPELTKLNTIPTFLPIMKGVCVTCDFARTQTVTHKHIIHGGPKGTPPPRKNLNVR